MLAEKISYQDDFPIKITVSNILDDPIHYHQDIEFLYVFSGSVELKNGSCNYTLREGDIFTNAGHEVHRITGNMGENVVAQIHISTKYFSRFFPEIGDACYRTYSLRAGDRRYDVLRTMLLSIIKAWMNREQGFKTFCTETMMKVIAHLDRYFNLFAFDKDVAVGFEKNDRVVNERIGRICRYIYRYYASNIGLEDLSELEHLSSFYISHLIKECTGMNFREFLCFARTERSEIMLLEGDRKISRIAKDVGFSTTAYYEKFFARWFGCDPEEHRQKSMPHVKSETHTLQNLLVSMEELQQIMIKRSTRIINPAREVPEITTDEGGAVNISGSFNFTVSMDDAEKISEFLEQFLKKFGVTEISGDFNRDKAEGQTAADQSGHTLNLSFKLNN